MALVANFFIMLSQKEAPKVRKYTYKQLMQTMVDGFEIDTQSEIQTSVEFFFGQRTNFEEHKLKKLDVFKSLRE